MACAAPQQTKADDAVTHDHHCGKDRIACQVCLFHRSRDHHGDDQRDLNNGDGNRQHNRAEWLANTMRNHFGMVHGGKNGGDERYSCGRSEHLRNGAIERRQKY